MFSSVYSKGRSKDYDMQVGLGFFDVSEIKVVQDLEANTIDSNPQRIDSE